MSDSTPIHKEETMAELTEKQFEKLEDEVCEHFISLAKNLSRHIEEGSSRLTVVYDFLITKKDVRAYPAIGTVAIFKEACDRIDLTSYPNQISLETDDELHLLRLRREELPTRLTQCLEDGHCMAFRHVYIDTARLKAEELR